MAKEKVKKPFYKKWWVWLIAVIIIGAAASGGEEGTNQAKDTEEKQEQTENTSEESKEVAAPEETKSDEKPAAKKGVLTEEKFAKINDGMTYEEVTAIIGAEGNLLSETGEKGTQFHTVMYEFETDGIFSNSTMMFQDNKLMNKAQFGLGGGSDVEITIDQFNQIQNGMTLEEVVAIVGGEGEIVSESGEKGTDFHTVMYSYDGNGGLGANVSLMFQGNKLQNKSQFGLE
jgi:hypothetical protein